MKEASLPKAKQIGIRIAVFLIISISLFYFHTVFGQIDENSSGTGNGTAELELKIEELRQNQIISYATIAGSIA
ncbi:MAG: hypothetical protein ACRD5H_15715, partial [Nitrososphaerales archaeon]